MRLVRLKLNRSLVLAVALVCAVGACGPDEDEVPAADATDEGGAVPVAPPPGSDEDARDDVAPGLVRGIVRSTETGDPVEGASVSAVEFGATTDASGAYALPPLPPGSVTIHAHRRGFVAESTDVVVAAGRMITTELSLDPAAPACCTLEGDWWASFTLDSAGLNSRPSARSVEGGLSFEVVVDEAEAAKSAGRVAHSSGSSDLDFGPLLGSDVGAVGELEGLAFSGDSVAVTLFPRFGDWAIELRGLQAADSIRGSWFQRASCCGAYGRFVLARDESRGAGRGSG